MSTDPSNVTSAVPARRGQVRPWLRRVAIVSVIVLVPVMAYSVWDYLALRRVIAEIEAIRAKGEPVTDPATHVERLPADQERAGDYYLAAATLAQHTAAAASVGGVHAWLARIGSGVAVPSSAPPSGATRGGTGASGTRPVPRVPAALVDDLRAAVESAPEALVLADKAAALPFGRLPPGPDGGIGARISGLNRLSQLIAARSLTLSLEGRGDEALDSARAAVAARRAKRELGWMARDDFEVAAIFSLSTPSATALRRFGDALDTTGPAVDPVQQLLVMRATYLWQTWRRYYGADPEQPGFYTLPMRSVGETLLRPIMSQRLARSLESWAAMMPVARLSEGRLQRMQALAQTRDTPELEAALSRMRYYTETLTIDRCLRAIIAVERFRRDHEGRVPASLAEVVPQYMPSEPRDPVIDAPLHYRAGADAYVVYGVGLDQIDDGGDLTSGPRPDTRAERASFTLRGRDVGLRVLIR